MKSFQVTLCNLKPRIPSSGKDQSEYLKTRQRWYFGQQTRTQKKEAKF